MDPEVERLLRLGVQRADQERRAARERRTRLAAGLPPEPTQAERMAWRMGYRSAY